MAEFLQQCGSWGVLATLAAYAAGVWVNRKTGKALFNPLLMGSIFMIVFLSCFGVPYADYKSSAQPVSWLLMPATVSLAIPLYEKWELLEKNLAAIFASIAAGVLTSLGSVQVKECEVPAKGDAVHIRCYPEYESVRQLCREQGCNYQDACRTILKELDTKEMEN